MCDVVFLEKGRSLMYLPPLSKYRVMIDDFSRFSTIDLKTGKIREALYLFFTGYNHTYLE